MSSRIPRPSVSSGAARDRTCCAKHRGEKAVTAQFENASGFSISKGDFSAIRGHRYGGLRISGKTIVIHQGSSSTSSRDKTARRFSVERPAYHGYHESSDSDESTATSSSGSTVMPHTHRPWKPRRTATSKYTERRTLMEDCAAELKGRRKELEEEAKVISCRQSQLDAREERLRAQEAEWTLREQIVHAREQDLDHRVQAVRVRQTELEERGKDLKRSEELIKIEEEGIKQREMLVRGLETRIGIRISALDDREAKLDERERGLVLRERDVQAKCSDLEQREEIVKKTQEELRQTERELLALEVRIKEQLQAMQAKCAELRRVRERFLAHRDGWLVAAAERATEFGNLEKEMEEIFGDFESRKRVAITPIPGAVAPVS